MPRSKSLKLVIDTNLWISFIISKKLNQLEAILTTENARVLFSSELVEELKATIAKPKLQKYFSENALDDMLDVFDPFVDFIVVKSKIQICRDPKDDFLLSLAKDGKANYLLTGDKDLLELAELGKTKITTITDFINKNNR
jgi:hypothetical protein